MFLEDSNGKSYSKEGRLIGCDPAYDLAVLKVWNCIICASSFSDVKLVPGCDLWIRISGADRCWWRQVEACSDWHITGFASWAKLLCHWEPLWLWTHTNYWGNDALKKLFNLLLSALQKSKESFIQKWIHCVIIDNVTVVHPCMSNVEYSDGVITKVSCRWLAD